MTAWKFNPGLTFEQVGGDWIVLDANAGVMLRASCPAAHRLTAIDNAIHKGTAPDDDLLPAHLDDNVAALAERGVLVANTGTDTPTSTNPNTDAHPADINGATTGITRRRLISTGALAAGAATLATTVGIHTLILPAAAAAASPSATLAAPTNVTATVDSATEVTIAWDLVPTATSYQVYFKLSSDSTCATSGGPVTNGPATVSGLTTGSPYDFYVVAIAGETTSLPSTIATATPAPVPGATWTTQTTPVALDLNGVTYGLENGDSAKPVFVAVASAGSPNRALSSPDGITWTQRTTVNNGWRGVTDGDPTKPLFVAVAISGDGNRVMTSP